MVFYYVDMPHLIYPLVDGQTFELFCFGAIINHAAINIWNEFLSRLIFSFLWWYKPWIIIAASYETQCLPF